MYRTITNLCVAALLSATPALVQAGPMGFKDSWMAMGDLGPNWQEGWVNYALTAFPKVLAACPSP